MFFELWANLRVTRRGNDDLLGSGYTPCTELSPHTQNCRGSNIDLSLLLLIFWSPPPIITQKSEKKYRSHSSTKPLPLTRLDEPSKVDLTVVVPAYNETERLPAMMADTIGHLSSLKTKRTFEILVVDDGSNDGTSSTALKLAAKYPKYDIKVVTLEKNIGKGGAVRHGMLYGGGERLLMADADGASRMEDLELLWKSMDEIAPNHGPGVVVGSRAHLVKSEAVVKVSLLPTTLHHKLTSTVSPALIPPKRAHVWSTHCLEDRRRRSYPGHPMWFQAILAISGSADISRPTSTDVDI